MCGKRKRESTENIFSELKISKCTDINDYLTGRFMYKCYAENVPGIFSDFFQCTSAVHGYSTRQNEHLHVPLERSDISQFCLRYRGVVVWNAILKIKINPDTSEIVSAKALKACDFESKWYSSFLCKWGMLPWRPLLGLLPGTVCESGHRCSGTA